MAARRSGGLRGLVGAGVPLGIAAMVAGLALAISGCGVGAVPRRDADRTTPAVPAGGRLLQGAGATFPSVLYQRWFQRYQAAHPAAVVVSYAPVGSGEGVRRFLAPQIDGESGRPSDDAVDFGASDAAMTDAELARAPHGAVLVPVTAGSVALAYNLPGLTADLRLSRQAYAGIFLGAITNWNDPRIARTNPGVALPKLTIVTIVRQEGSGTTFAFTTHLDAVSAAWHSRFGAATLIDWPGSAMRATGNEGVAGRITQSVGSIGYVGDEFARKAGLKVAVLENHAGAFVAPSEASATAGLAALDLPENRRGFVPDPEGRDAYPIVTLTWILLRRSYDAPGKAADLRDLFRWCLTDGQQDAAALGYIQLPSGIARRSLAALDEIGPAR